MRSTSLLPLLFALGCTADPAPAANGLPTGAWDATGRYASADGALEVYFTQPGTQNGEQVDPDLDDALIALLDGATQTVDVAAYSITEPRIADAIVRAHQRGLNVRVVGDGDQAADSGFVALLAAGVPVGFRPAGDAILHHKYALIDGAVLWAGSTNFTTTGLLRNNNGSIVVHNAEVVAQVAAEFEQMAGMGRFGPAKATILTQPVTVGDHTVHAHLAPSGDPEGAMLGMLATADQGAYAMTYVFNRAPIADKLIALHQAGVDVVVIVDESQAISTYSEAARLAQAGVPTFLDGNHNTIGYGGGKLHHKTLVVDPLGSSDPSATFGSFNWTFAAANDNDEDMLEVHGPELPRAAFEELCRVLAVATPHPDYTGPQPTTCAAAQTTLRINELLADPAGTDTGREWVELVNAGSAPVALAGWSLGDLSNRARHVFASGVLAPGERVVVAAGTAANLSGAVIASSGSLSLNNSSDELFLTAPTGLLIDHVAYQGAVSGVSFNRDPDGAASGPFALHDALSTTASSPGAPMPVSTQTWTGAVVLNEVMADPAGADTGNEWIELVNQGATALDLNGWTLEDGVRVRHVFAPGSVVGPGRSVVVFDSGSHPEVPGALVASTGALALNNGAETVSLRTPSGVLHDQVSWTAAPSGSSQSRAVDGDTDAALVAHELVPGAVGGSSPGQRADGSAWGPSILVNELMANPTGADAGNEWVEVVNAGGFDVDLGGWTLGDAARADRHSFAPGTLLAAHSALVLFDAGTHADVPGALVSSSGALSLNNTGDVVTLADAQGTAVSVASYGTAADGVSFNRASDGDGIAALIPHTDLAPATSSPGQRADGSGW